MSAVDDDLAAKPTETLPAERGPTTEGCRIQVVDGPDAGATAELRQGRLEVGSSQSCGLRLTDGAVSRRHFSLELVKGGICVEDLNSTNGTFHLGVRLTKAVLPRGAVVTVGRTRLALLSPEPKPGPEFSPLTSYGAILGASPAMRRMYAVLSQLEREEYTVLVCGETGCGKELVAREIHAHSRRRDKPYEVFDCGAVPANLAESELFGHVRGAFTGADTARDGVFVHAHGGTLLLDEIGELPMELQPKLLRVLENRQLRPVGSNTTRQVDVRVIAATHRHLAEEVRAGRFREDLFFRLDVVAVEVPPLRERREDIPTLVHHFLAESRCADVSLSDETWEHLTCGYDWPGNVRELRNAVARVISLGEVPPRLRRETASRRAPRETGASGEPEAPYLEAKKRVLDAFERDYLASQLQHSDNNLAKAARMAGIDRSHFKRLLRRHGLLPGSKP